MPDREGGHRPPLSQGHPRIQEACGTAWEGGTSVGCPLSWAPVPCEAQALPPGHAAALCLGPCLPIPEIQNPSQSFSCSPGSLSPVSLSFPPSQSTFKTLLSESARSPGSGKQMARRGEAASGGWLLSGPDTQKTDPRSWKGKGQENLNHLNTNWCLRKESGRTEKKLGEMSSCPNTVTNLQCGLRHATHCL